MKRRQLCFGVGLADLRIVCRVNLSDFCILDGHDATTIQVVGGINFHHLLRPIPSQDYRGFEPHVLPARKEGDMLNVEDIRSASKRVWRLICALMEFWES